MSGLFIGKSSDGIERVEQGSGDLALLAHGEGTEVMLQQINPGKNFSVYPADEDDVMEFFYIVKGSIVCEYLEEPVTLRAGDYFYVNRLKREVSFDSIDGVTLLYVTSSPLFHSISNELKELGKVVEKVEEKDIHTRNHGARVQDYSVKTAKRCGLSGIKLHYIAYAGMFHDIGKINVPDEVLLKPERLTAKEFEYIKKHPEDGKKLIQGTLIENLGDIIAQHHEKLDGTGYPNGLSGNQICLEARIISVADVYDAITTDRPYKKGLEPIEAICELKKYAGKYYDKEIVGVFENILREEGKI